ncbi:hypothetical protein OL239_17865 [Arthrobacter sp. ATA002]|uniref:hypothetical protein n=1 Tax=Arthrobacter sp. ATA002 TaxID=2991715 RepID=UPI0022A66865|nr:hypothetical protein [Arthrobacter sp. ATA002]WAP51610.1 hypothetical protein OL239_17865 [Arthrobacter sp. ATA002]
MAGTAEAAAELYALMPGEFTAARNRRAAEAAEGGDKGLGKAIRSLPKPSSAAWLVNMLCLHRTELISEVLELGAVLREAQNDLDQQQLRRLSGERQRLLRSVAREALSLAGQLGHPVSAAVGAEVEQTLWAAMTDADAAAAAASGQLVRGLEANGWDPVDVAGAVADPGSVRPPAAGGTRSSSPRSGTGGDASAVPSRKEKAAADRARRTARAALEEAQRDAARAEEALKSAQDEVDKVAGRRDELTDEIDELRVRIHELEREVVSVDRRAGALERARDAARRSARAARRAAEKAQSTLEGLG